MRVIMKVVAVLVTLLATGGLAGCAESQRVTGGQDTLVFGVAGEPTTMDPAFDTGGATYTVTNQIFEGLVSTAPGTADPKPGLATSWEVRDGARTFDFRLRGGVRFQDGTPFDAKAVCYNFDRWYHFPESVQSPELTYYYGYLFGGFAAGSNSGQAIYKSCEVRDEHNVRITLTQPFAGLIDAMTMPSFYMQSPTALERWQDASAANVHTTEYSTSHPVGTGPFAFGSWKRGDRITLVRNDDYWGEKAKVEKVVAVKIDDTRARVTALRNGEVDAIDLIGPADVEPLEDAGFKVVSRPAFTILYLGFNQMRPPLDDVRVRQAVAHAIDKRALIQTSLPESSEPATQFLPPSVRGWTDDVPDYEYNPDKARELLEQAGALGKTIEFNYPAQISRPYLPSSDDTFNVLRSQLEAVGLKVKPSADVWSPDYIDKIYGTADHGIHVLGWIGIANIADSFIGLAFGLPAPEWGFDDPELFKRLSEAKRLPDLEQQTAAYEDISRDIMELVPGVPLAHVPSMLAFAPGVSGFEPSPLTGESWSTISMGH